MTNQTLVMTDVLYDYLLSVSLREPEVLRQLRQATAKMSAGARFSENISPSQNISHHTDVNINP
jgi:hypothetical protein